MEASDTSQAVTSAPASRLSPYRDRVLAELSCLDVPCPAMLGLVSNRVSGRAFKLTISLYSSNLLDPFLQQRPSTARCYHNFRSQIAAQALQVPGEVSGALFQFNVTTNNNAKSGPI